MIASDPYAFAMQYIALFEHSPGWERVNVSEGTTGTAHEIPIPALGPSLEVVAGEYHPSEATPHSPQATAKEEVIGRWR